MGALFSWVAAQIVSDADAPVAFLYKSCLMIFPLLH